jgi:hypothetical protein
VVITRKPSKFCLNLDLTLNLFPAKEFKFENIADFKLGLYHRQLYHKLAVFTRCVKLYLHWQCYQ